MKTQWGEASERTKRRHTRKAKQAVDAVLDEVAPNQSDQLWQSLVTSKSMIQHRFSDDEERADEVLTQGWRLWRNATRMLIIGKPGGKYCL